MPKFPPIARLALLLLTFSRPALSAQEPPAKVTVAWKNITRVSRTTLTLQVVVNPPLRRGSAIHDAAWNSLRQLGADYVRFVPWYPYPRLGVAELDPPAKGKTSWDFSLIDPLVTDFFASTAPHPIMLNFSTIPQWMYKTPDEIAYPADPSEPFWSYEQGAELRDPSGQEVADYYARLASWYVRGGFTDELGQPHPSSHHQKIAYWEILNEPEYEHAISAATYTKLYDAIVQSVRPISPETKFVGMSLAEPMKSAPFFEYFLNANNHRSKIPLDMISYHFYAVPTADQPPPIQQFTFFEQADKFLTSVGFIEAIRQRLSPHTQTDINETGCIQSSDIGQASPGEKDREIPKSYWNLCGAVFAYVYAGVANQGINILGASQLVGYPTQFPSVTMLDWNHGQPNARYRVLQLLKNSFGPGDALVETKTPSPYVLAQGFVTKDGVPKLLLINKRDRPLAVDLPGASGGLEMHVDQLTGGDAPASTKLPSDQVLLQGYSVMVVTPNPQTAARN